MILVWLNSIYNNYVITLMKIGDISDNEDEGSTESETDHGTGLTKRTISGGTTHSSVVNSNLHVTGNPRDKEKNSGELEDADNPEAGVMSNDNSSSEPENTGDPKVVVMSDDASTDGAGVNSNELKKSDNPETLTSDGACCDVFTQSQAKPAKITLVDDSSKRSADLPCDTSNDKPADSHTTGIKAPAIVKRRSRPRGHELTTIGLPAKKAKKESAKKPCSFSKMHSSKKEEGRSLAINFNVATCILTTVSYVNYLLQ